MIDLIIQWLRRILKIGVLDFLASLGWKIWLGLVLTIVGLFGIIIVLTLILVAVLL